MFPTHSSQVNPATIPEQQSAAWYGPTLAHSPNSNMIAPKFPTPPSTGNPAVTPNSQSLQDAQTSPPDHTLPGIATIADLGPSGNSSRPTPMKDFLSAHQTLQRMEAMWFQRYEDLGKELEAKFHLWFQQSEAVWFQRFLEWYERREKQNKELEEKSAEIARLTVRSSSPMLLLLCLTGI